MENDNFTVENNNISEVETIDNSDAQPKKKNIIPNILCIVSAVLIYVVPLLSVINCVDEWSDLHAYVFFIGFAVTLLDPILAIPELAGLILMIILRVKYPRHVGGKILMWLTIAYVVIFGIGIIVLIKSCNDCVSSCLPCY